MEKALGLRGPMFTTALKTPGLKIVMGTDAVAGAHGQNAREPIERVKTGQKPMDAIVGMTSLAAESMGLDKELGAIAAGLERRSRRRRRRSAAGHHGAAARAIRHAKWKGVQAMKQILLASIVATRGRSTLRLVNAQPSVTIFENGRVIVGDGKVIENASFVVQGARITQVGPAAIIKAPAGADARQPRRQDGDAGDRRHARAHQHDGAGARNRSSPARALRRRARH